MTWTAKDGSPIEFEFFDNDPEDSKGVNKGYVVRRVAALVGGESAGYLKISYVPAERVPEVYPTVWHWTEAMRGWCFDPTDLVSTWMHAHHANYVPESLAGTGVSYLGLTRDMVPDADTMRSDLAALADKPMRSLGYRSPNDAFEDFLRVSVDYAFVDHIQVFERFRRQGIGTALYNEGARWLAERFGLPLHGSGLQSDEARATWESMVASGKYPIEQITREDGKLIWRMGYLGGLKTASPGVVSTRVLEDRT